MATDRERTAYHEAGHAVLASVLEHPPKPQIEAHLLSLYAGFFAQRQLDPEQDEIEAQAEANSDFETADIWADEFDLQSVRNNAQSLILAHWQSVQMVARGLLHRERLLPEEADAFLAIGEGTDIDFALRALVNFLNWSLDDVHTVTGI